MAKVLCVLYDDPVDGYPTSYARDEIPQIDAYPGGQTTPSPHAIDFTPGRAAGQRVRRAGAAQRSWRPPVTRWWSPPTRTARTRSSSGSCPTPTS